jgi:glycosyltransferase involved in cell wall biosynthesis
MKILIFNWRSIKDPLAGGAELATIEYAKRWVKNHRAEVIWISPPYNDKIKSETIEGINFEYLGKTYKRDKTLEILFKFPYFYLLCYLKYRFRYKGKVDIVIDQSHGFPFLTPVYVNEKIILFIHEFADIIWDEMFIFPINVIGKKIEKLILSFYKNLKTITGSQSTKNDLVNKLDFNPKNISIVNYAINLKVIEKPQIKYDQFTLLFLNRVVKMKRPEIAIKIFKKIKENINNSQLIIAGKYSKDYKKELEELIKKNKITNVVFKGYISEKEKIELLQKSHVLINTSIKEGWGIVNIEANSQGTPVVAFDVEGCRDSVKDGINGYLAQNEDDFVEKIIRLSKNNLQQSSIEYSKKFNYDEKSEEFWKILNEK